MKAAIVVLSDPENGSAEAQGRAFNALAAAYEFKKTGDDVTILFQGAGSRWAGLLNSADHPFHSLFASVADKVSGVSCGCADVFGARETAQAAGFALRTENAVPGTTGLPSLRSLVAQGYNVLTF